MITYGYWNKHCMGLAYRIMFIWIRVVFILCFQNIIA